MRANELCGLKWSDITLSDRKGKLLVNAGSDTFILTSQRRALSSRGVQFMLNRLKFSEGLSAVSPHQLRHTFCKNLVDAGVSLEKVDPLQDTNV